MHRFNNIKIHDPGNPIGIISAQSITQPLTQDTLSSFHKTGSKNQMTENIEKFKELTHDNVNNNTSMCNIILNKKISNKNIYCMLVYKRFSDFVKNMVVYDKKHLKEYWLKRNINDYDNVLEINIHKKYQYKYKCLNNIIITLKKYLEEKINDTYLIINSPEHMSKILIFYNNLNIIIDEIKFKNISFCGIKNIIDIIKIEENNNKKTVTTIGSNLKLVLSNKYVDKINTKSNNINDVYNTLGIESARYVLLKLLKDVLNVSAIEHILILVDCMTVLGKITTINSRGFSAIDKGFLSNLSYENSIKTLKKNIAFGIHEDINNISKNLIVGRKPNIGTNIIKIYKKININVIYFNKSDEKYIDTSYNNKIIIKKNASVILHDTNNIIKKISNSIYIFNGIFNININKILFTILKVNINRNIFIDLYDKNCLKIIINDINYIKDLKYEIIQGNNIFEIIVENAENGYVLFHGFITSKQYKNNLNINQNTKNKNNIKISIKPTNQIYSKIVIGYL